MLLSMARGEFTDPLHYKYAISCSSFKSFACCKPSRHKQVSTQGFWCQKLGHTKWKPQFKLRRCAKHGVTHHSWAQRRRSVRNKAFLELQPIPSLLAKRLIRYRDYSSYLLTGGFIFLHESTSSSPKYSRSDECQQRTQIISSKAEASLSSSLKRKAMGAQGTFPACTECHHAGHGRPKAALPSQADVSSRTGKGSVLQM